MFCTHFQRASPRKPNIKMLARYNTGVRTRTPPLSVFVYDRYPYFNAILPTGLLPGRSRHSKPEIGFVSSRWNSEPNALLRDRASPRGGIGFVPRNPTPLFPATQPSKWVRFVFSPGVIYLHPGTPAIGFVSSASKPPAPGPWPLAPSPWPPTANSPLPSTSLQWKSLIG